MCIEKSLNDVLEAMARDDGVSTSSLKPMRRSRFIESLFRSVAILPKYSFYHLTQINEPELAEGRILHFGSCALLHFPTFFPVDARIHCESRPAQGSHESEGRVQCTSHGTS